MIVYTTPKPDGSDDSQYFFIIKWRKKSVINIYIAIRYSLKTIDYQRELNIQKVSLYLGLLRMNC